MTRQELINRSEALIIYDAETFNRILGRLPDYAALFERVSAQLGKDSEKLSPAERV